MREGRVDELADLTPDAIDLASCYQFWKDDGKTHLVGPDAAVRLEDIPGEYFYTAQQWLPVDTSAPIVLLLRQH